LYFGTDYLMVLFFGEMSFMRGCGNEGEVNELWMSEVITQEVWVYRPAVLWLWRGFTSICSRNSTA
jgi:hypothetical protein